MSLLLCLLGTHAPFNTGPDRKPITPRVSAVRRDAGHPLTDDEGVHVVRALAGENRIEAAQVAVALYRTDYASLSNVWA